MTTNIYTEHANITTLYDREVEKNRILLISVKVLGFAWIILLGSWLILLALGFRSDGFFRSESVCPAPNYNLCLPQPVPTPIQK